MVKEGTVYRPQYTPQVYSDSEFPKTRKSPKTWILALIPFLLWILKVIISSHLCSAKSQQGFKKSQPQQSLPPRISLVFQECQSTNHRPLNSQGAQGLSGYFLPLILLGSQCLYNLPFSTHTYQYFIYFVNLKGQNTGFAPSLHFAYLFITLYCCLNNSLLYFGRE